MNIVKPGSEKKVAKCVQLFHHHLMVEQLAPQSATLNLRTKIEKHAKSLGFDLVGFSTAKIEDKYLQAFDKWLATGHEGTMSYMRKIEKRRDLTKILPGAKSVIVLATNYYRKQPRLRPGHGIVARYAYGHDYHKVIGKKLRQLEKFIQDLAIEKGLVSQSKCHRITKSYVDTGPVLERALAEQAGIGRIGKNSCLITKEFGSWVFLSEIITNLDLAISNRNNSTIFKTSIPGRDVTSPVLPLSTMGAVLTKNEKDRRPNSATIANAKILADKNSSADRWENPEAASSKDRWSNPKALSANICGNCTRCIDACPTSAIIAPGIIDARLCISYLTIENKDKIPPRLAKIIAKTKRLYGCDICQEVCPHNSARQKSIEQGAANANTFTTQNSIHRNLTEPRIAGSQLSLKKIVAIKTDQQFLETFAGSPLMRVKREGLTRNVQALRKT